ncbi:MAG TPA: chalcone isomerase family protein [Bdellovibrionales bacterium]|nr:chalcone isomerase family protein [Bdellovibrionales bacterium]
MRIVILLSLCVWTVHSLAAKIEHVTVPDSLTVGATRLVINGTALKAKLGKINKVYAGALYTVVPNNDPAALIASPQLKVLDLVFMNAMDRETLQETWKAEFEKACTGDACANNEFQLKALQEALVDMRPSDRIRLTFEKDGTHIDVKAKKSKNAQIIGEDFRKAVLAMFLGPNADPKFRDGLLGSATP